MSDLELSDSEIQLKPTFSIKNDALITADGDNYDLGDEIVNDEDSIVNLDDDDNEDDNNEDDDNDDNDDVDDDVDDDDVDDDDDDDDDDDVDDDVDVDNDDDEKDTMYHNNKKSTSYGGKKITNKNVEEMPLTKIDIPTNIDKNDSDFDSGDDDEDDDEYLQKFDKEMRENYILQQHPETNIHNYDEVYKLAIVQRNKNNIIVDDLHKTIPMLTKYEKTKVLGLRAKQLNNGAKPFVKFSKNIIDGYLIALQELEEKKIPVIIRRPLPNGASEYWHLRDLEII